MGQVLNMISEWTFNQTRDIVPNALVENVDASVVVQKKMRNLNVEFIIRGYLWGSMAAAYEKGDREFCGLKVEDGLNRFQKFDAPLFTPTTKAEVGHDENMTMEEVEKLIGKEMAEKAREASLKLFERGTEIMRKRGLILIDTKYEFGLDEAGKLHVIDEVNTPDSSRLCDVEEWETKWPKIAEAMATGKHANVTELLKAQPELKIKEFSKQYVRDGLIRGCNAVIMAGSDSDMPHLETLKKELAKFKIPSQIRICSAHKQPTQLQAVLSQYNKSIEPILIVGCAGGTDALSGTASYLSRWPVVSCPPDGMNQSCLTNPPGSSNAFIVKPANVARFAAQVFSHVSPEVAAAMEAGTVEKIR